ncbi:hypothetical protein BRI9_3481 [plant metagenome]|uniref:Uncharacterized protein n=1 Tax=plant metagenome TaxID=1297885 RepID=A0A484VIL5_9ZZZZ
MTNLVGSEAIAPGLDLSGAPGSRLRRSPGAAPLRGKRAALRGWDYHWTITGP